MKYFFITILVLGLASYSCSTNQRQQPNTPSTFQESGSSGLIKKRGYLDVVESLYEEEVKKSAALKDLENAIQELNQSKDDSLSKFNEYNSNNNNYYSSANQHAGHIKDSILRIRIRSYIDSSFKKYDAFINMHKNLISEINQKEMNLSDLHIILKLTSTLPVLEVYQRESIPSARTLELLKNNFDKRIDQTEKLIKDTIR